MTRVAKITGICPDGTAWSLQHPWGRVLRRDLEPKITMPGLLERDLLRTLERGYGINREESEVEVSAVAAPVFDHRGRVIAAISITGHAGRLDLDRLAPAVRTSALSLSRESHATANRTLRLPTTPRADSA